MPHRPPKATQLFAIVEPGSGGYDCRVADGEGNVVLRIDGYRTTDIDGSLPPGLIQPIHDAMSG